MATERNQGSQGFGGTWLEPFLGSDKAFSYDKLSGELKDIGCNKNASVSSIKRLVGCRKLLKNDSYLADKLAKLVNALRTGDYTVNAAHLCAAQAREIRRRDHLKACQQPVNSAMIATNLKDCRTNGLEALIDQWRERANIDSGDSLAETIAKFLSSDDLGAVKRIIDGPLSSTLLDTDKLNRQQLNCIGSLLGAIAVSSAVPCEKGKLHPGQAIIVFDADKDWSIRLVIDAALGHPLTHVSRQKRQLKVDDGYAAQLEVAESPNPKQQALQILNQFDHDNFLDDDMQIPETSPDNYVAQSKDYYNDLNDAVFYGENDSIHHRFLYQIGEHSADTLAGIRNLGIRDLRIVQVLPAEDGEPSLRLDQRQLAGWLVARLKDIDNARQSLQELENNNAKSGGIEIHAKHIAAIGKHNTVNEETSHENS